MAHGAQLANYPSLPQLSLQIDLFWTDDDEARVYALGYATDMRSWNVQMLKYVATQDEIEFLPIGVHPEVANVFLASGIEDPDTQAKILKELDEAGMYQWHTIMAKYDIGKGLPFKLMLRQS